MIVSIQIENFGCFKERQYLSFEATDSDHLRSHYTEVAGKKILQMATVIGANASGKTTILNAIIFLSSLVRKSKNDISEGILYDPFFYSADKAVDSSFLSMDFIANDKLYSYSVSFTQQKIVEESLCRYDKIGPALIYRRDSSGKDQTHEIFFGEEIVSFYAKGDRDSELDFLQYQTLPNSTVLSAYRKVNIRVPECIRDVAEFFASFRSKMNNSLMSPRTAQQYFKTYPKLRDLLLDFIQRADFGIQDIQFKKSNVLNQDFFNHLRKDGNDGQDVYPYFEEGAEEPKWQSMSWVLVREVDGKLYHLGIGKESEGTKRFLTLMIHIVVNFLSGGVLVIDELDSSLHPDLFRFIIFMMNHKDSKSQVIFTTHDFVFLQDKDYYRYDNVWMVGKKRDLSSEVYRLSDFGDEELDNLPDIHKAYMKGQFGAKPIVSYPYRGQEKNGGSSND